MSDAPLLRADFETPPQEAGWVAHPAKEGGEPPWWTDAEAHAGTHCLAAAEGWWESPTWPVAPGDYTRVRVHSRLDAEADGDGLWGIVFFDREGRPLEADHHSGFDPSTQWSETVGCVRAKARATHAALRLHGREGVTTFFDDVEVRPASRQEAAAWADAVYATIPPVGFAPPPDRWALLPRTAGVVRSGGTLRMVLLGDSIANDTGNSAFDVLVERANPGAKVELVTSVRGGTGCWYYRDANGVEHYVLRHKPDLLLIGGISHRNDMGAIRSVVEQVRRRMTPDILLLTGAFGRDQDPRELPDWELAPDPAGTGYRSQLLNLAKVLRTGFFDLRGAWGEYLLGCGQPLARFMRDPVHANARGGQILARVLERYFTLPPSPERRSPESAGDGGERPSDGKGGQEA